MTTKTKAKQENKPVLKIESKKDWNLIRIKNLHEHFNKIFTNDMTLDKQLVSEFHSLVNENASR